MRNGNLAWILPLALVSGGLVPQAQESEGAGHSSVQTVSAVDLNRYTGIWHEVAKIPNRYQKKCDRGTTATYSILPDGRIQVINACTKRDGSENQVRGVARVTDPQSNARLEVSFVSFLGWRPFWGDYWIIGLDPDYHWAVIGTPDRKYGWILSRTPVLPAPEFQRAFDILIANGYERDQFTLSKP